MKKLGLLGGMSWESTALYYREINRETRARMGGLHSAPLLLSSVNFATIACLQSHGQWNDVASLLISEAQALEAAGAKFLMICSITAHKVAQQVQAAIEIPVLHIADSLGAEIVERGINTVALLGTRYTMESEFILTYLSHNYGLNILVPDKVARAEIHRIIFDELCVGITSERSRVQVLEISEGLASAGADGLILGCTELGFLIDPTDTALQLFDTLKIHVRAAVEMSLKS